MPDPYKEVWLAMRADGSAGSGKPDDPWDISSPWLFTKVINDKIGQNSAIHIGPGIFQITGYDPATPNEFKITLPAAPETDQLNVVDAVAKAGHTGLNGAEGRGCITERNRVFNCAIGGPYHDTWNARE